MYATVRSELRRTAPSDTTPARSFLMIPPYRSAADRLDPAFAPDAIVLDLYEGWASQSPGAARAAAVEALLPPRRCRSQVWARIRPGYEPEARRDAEALAGLVDGLIVPETSSAAELDALAEASDGTPLMPVIECAAGVAALGRIVSHPSVVRLGHSGARLALLDAAGRRVLGCGPGARRRAMLAVVLASASEGLPGPVHDVRGGLPAGPGLLAGAAAAAELGFTGQCVGSPGELPALRRLFGALPGPFAA
ncbi:aldolase/citrate lyase family protein [Kitasatospora sp. NPDC089509]|uniref:aldolase/citrate lyase family protein n=1 Tax=Kitasatospora sp. NPDC089509 TaxID=3364079 RepID=UPI00382B205F